MAFSAEIVAGDGGVAQGLQNADDLVDAGEVPGVCPQSGGDGVQGVRLGDC